MENKINGDGGGRSGKCLLNEYGDSIGDNKEKFEKSFTTLWGKKPQPTLVMSQQHQTNRQKTSGDRQKVGYLDKWLPQHTW